MNFAMLDLVAMTAGILEMTTTIVVWHLAMDGVHERRHPHIVETPEVRRLVGLPLRLTVDL